MVEPAACARAGIRHCWRVEPSPPAPPTVFCSQLSEAEYLRSCEISSGRPGVVKAAPVDVDLDVDELYEASSGPGR